MGEPVDLSQLRAKKSGDGPGGAGERTPLAVQLIGTPGGPWALIGDGGYPIATGLGDDTRTSMLAFVSLAALAFRVATPEAVQEAVGQAQATVAAQVAGWQELNRLADLGRAQELAAACERFHPGEECQPGQNHPAAAEAPGPTIQEG